jgi:hypothetical protein
MSKEEHDAIFPLLRMGAEGKLDPKMFSDADMIVVGDVDQCLKKMLKYQDLGVDELICYVQFGYLPHESVMRTIELLGTEIIPELAKHEVEVEATVSSPAAFDPNGMNSASRIID